jgi:hypothetical protein
VDGTATSPPQSQAQSTERDDFSAKLVDELNNRTFDTWQNGEKGAAVAVSPTNPALITLTWTQPVTLSGVCLQWARLHPAEATNR